MIATAAVLAGCGSSGGGGGASSGSDRGLLPSPVGPVAAAPSAGCQLSDPVRPGLQKISILAAGEEGVYFRVVPAAYTGRSPLPVVLDLHGYDEAIEVHSRVTSLGSYGNSRGFIVITPRVTRETPSWDAKVDHGDMAFVGGLLDDLERTLCTDQNRVFVAGYSNGAAMASAIACRYADRIAAVAAVAGMTTSIPNCAPARPMPVVAFHGTADRYVPYDGSASTAGAGASSGGDTATHGPKIGPSIPEMASGWARRNRCGTIPVESSVADDVTLLAFRCPPGTNVMLYRINGGGHTWPGSEEDRQFQGALGKVTFSISANDTMWAFFQAHPLRL